MLKIKEIAREKGYTMQQLADKLGIVRDTLTRQAHGNPTISTLQKIAEVLEVDITELFDTGAIEKYKKITAINCPKCGEEIRLSIEEEN